MNAFDLYDYTSLYLADWQKKWIEETYMAQPDRAAKFEELCKKNEEVSVTSNAMFVARYFLDVDKVVVFPWVIISRSLDLGVGNWKMLLLDESATIYCKVPIGVIVERIKKGEPIHLVPHLDKSYYDLTI